MFYQALSLSRVTLSGKGGGPDEERWSRIHVERSPWLHPYLPLKPWNRAQSWCPHTNPTPQQSTCTTSHNAYHHAYMHAPMQHPKFGEVLKKLRLQKRGTGGVDTAAEGSTYDISNIDRLGKSEVTPVIIEPNYQ